MDRFEELNWLTISSLLFHDLVFENGQSTKIPVNENFEGIKHVYMYYFYDTTLSSITGLHFLE